MLRLDPSIHPDPFKPEANDAYGSAPGRPDLVIYDAIFDDYDRKTTVKLYWLGAFRDMGARGFPAFLASAGLRPVGRMTAEPLPVGPRIDPGQCEVVDPVEAGLGRAPAAEVQFHRSTCGQVVCQGLVENGHQAVARARWHSASSPALADLASHA